MLILCEVYEKFYVFCPSISFTVRDDKMQGICSNRMKRQQDERHNKPVNSTDFSLPTARRVRKKVNGQTPVRGNTERTGESKRRAGGGRAEEGEHVSAGGPSVT